MMAKDPAFLFYYQDFLVGTEFMEDDEVGKYIRILCHLAHKGSLTQKQVLSICRASAITDNILDKLEKDEDGTYFNKRLREEMQKRKKFTESRRKNAASAKHMPKHMENENENSYNLLFNKIKKEFNLTPKQEELFKLWLKYKSEKGQSYKATGLKTLIKQTLLETNNDEKSLESMINFSIKNNYQGLFREKNNGEKKDKNEVAKPTPKPDYYYKMEGK